MRDVQIKRMIQRKQATVDIDDSQPQRRQVVAAAGKLRVKVEGKPNGQTNNRSGK